MRLRYFNMSEPGISCPTSLRQINTPTKLCGLTGTGCSGVTFPTDGIHYSKVCGQTRATSTSRLMVLDTVPITSTAHMLMGLLSHTYATGLSDDDNYSGGIYNCPCATPPGKDPPAFVGLDYYCESGVTGQWQDNNRIALDDLLWDGDGCGPGNNCCNQTGMPWFYRTLPQEVGDDFEVRLCGNQSLADETYVDLLEIYIQ